MMITLLFPQLILHISLFLKWCGIFFIFLKSLFCPILQYVKICNSHTFVLPNKPQFNKAVEEWTTSFSAPIEMSMFQDQNKVKITSNTNEVHIHEDGIECPTCGKPGFVPNLEDVFEKVLVN